MTKLIYLTDTFEGDYGYCLDKEKNVMAEKNRKCLHYYDQKIACSQKDRHFTERGHYLFDYVPMVFSREDWFDDDVEKKNGTCDVVITDMISKKKLKYSLQLATMFPNKKYLHGILKNGNKRYGGLAFLVDNCLHSYSELEEAGILDYKELKANHGTSFPMVDVELTCLQSKRKTNESFFHSESISAWLAEVDQLKGRLNSQNKYVYCVFKIDEYWLIPLANGEINELYTSKYVTIQAFSETWLVENGLPINTPILAQSGDSHSDRENSSSGHYRMGGQVVISDEEATLLTAIDRERNRYFIIPKGRGCSGKSYEFNKKPKWGKNDPRPTCCVSGFPLFSSNFN